MLEYAHKTYASLKKSIDDNANALDFTFSGLLMLASSYLSTSLTKGWAPAWIALNMGGHYITNTLVANKDISKETKVIIDEMFNACSLAKMPQHLGILFPNYSLAVNKAIHIALTFNSFSFTDKCINMLTKPAEEIKQQFDTICIFNKQFFSQWMKFSFFTETPDHQRFTPTLMESFLGGAASYAARALSTININNKLLYKIDAFKTTSGEAEKKFDKYLDGYLGSLHLDEETCKSLKKSTADAVQKAFKSLKSPSQKGSQDAEKLAGKTVATFNEEISKQQSILTSEQIEQLTNKLSDILTVYLHKDADSYFYEGILNVFNETILGAIFTGIGGELIRLKYSASVPIQCIVRGTENFIKQFYFATILEQEEDLIGLPCIKENNLSLENKAEMSFNSTIIEDNLHEMSLIQPTIHSEL